MERLTSHQLRRRYIDFFVKRYAHAEIPSSSVIPENDPTVLFTTAGMHPLVPYLLGESHPSGKRLVDAQKCIRTDDIDEVGDASHCTFFEMMGNWSLGDYFKKEAIEMSFAFLTGGADALGVGLDPKRLYVTVFAGDSDAPKDDESVGHWQAQFKTVGIDAREGVAGKDEPANCGDGGGASGGASGGGSVDGPRIYSYEKKKNWWGPAGATGPCGPDTEMFYLVNPEQSHDARFGSVCHPNCDCGRFVEIWNDVFMQYNKTAEGKYEPLAQQNVDTGLGLDRVAAILQGAKSIFETEVFADSLAVLRGAADAAGGAEHMIRRERIILDHIRAAVFILGDRCGVAPSNTDQGYILRRLIRRAIRCGRQIGISGLFTTRIAEPFITVYAAAYPELSANRERILKELDREESRFLETLVKGEKEFEKPMQAFQQSFDGDVWLVAIMSWFNLLRQSIDVTGTEAEAISGFLLPKMGDIQKIVRNRSLSAADQQAQLTALCTDEQRDMLRAFAQRVQRREVRFSGERAFYFYETYGFPKELIQEMLREYDIALEEPSFDTAFAAHQELSRAGAEQKFAGGLADHSWECTLLHTATHLVHQALRDVLGTHVFQRGSNITRDRLRFDFSHNEKMTSEQLARVEEIVNTQIKRAAPVHYEMLTIDQAKARGAIGLFEDKYAQLGNKIKVYVMGDYSKEVCGGPHVANTGVLKSFKITKEEAVSDGVRRIKAIVGGLSNPVPEIDRVVATER